MRSVQWRGGMLLVRCSGLHFDVLQLTSPFIEGRFSVSLLAVGVQRTADVLHVPTGILGWCDSCTQRSGLTDSVLAYSM